MAKQQARIFQKHDTEANWKKNGTNFIPGPGEIIIYDKDEEHSIPRFKIGDGQQAINDLPFAGSDLSGTVLYTPQTLTEEQQTQARTNIGAVSEEDVIDMIENGVEPQVNATGELIDFNFEEETPITVISKIHRDSTWGLADQLVLHQVKGKNYVDLSAYVGEPGTTFEVNGVTATINDDGTLYVSGTNTGSGWAVLFRKTISSGDVAARVYPPGTYTIPSGVTIQICAAKYPAKQTISGFANLEGTKTIPVPFRVSFVMYEVAKGVTIDKIVPLGLYRDKPIPTTDFEYQGNIYTATFDQPVYDGEFNWTTGELKDIDGNTIGYYEAPKIIGMEGDNHFWTGFGENTITNLQEKERIVIQLNETVPDGSMPSICDFTLKPITPLCAYCLFSGHLLENSNGKFAGREIPMLTTQGDLKVLDRDGNIKFTKYIDPIINVNRNGWSVSDTLTQNGLYKMWSNKFYLTMGKTYTSIETFTYDGGATNSLYTFEFDESDFSETGIPAKLDDIPVASPCFYTGNNASTYLNGRVYGEQPFPLKFSYNQETGRYIMTIRGTGLDILNYQLTSYSKAYIYYQLETPYYENDFLAMGLSAGDKVTFENDYSTIQEYLDTTGFFKGSATGNGSLTDIDITPAFSAVIPLNAKIALNGFSNAAKIFNKGQTASKDVAQDYSWIGDAVENTDYTSTIQKKIDELVSLSEGGTIYLGNGTYKISKFIELRDNIKLIGTGNTTIQQTDKSEHVIVLSGSNVAIKDIRLKLYAMTAAEKDDPSSYNSELTACVFVNSNNIPGRNNYNSKYLQNTYCKNLTMDNVSLTGSYGFRYVDGYPIISNDYEYYKGCGLYSTQLFFNYATLTNVHIGGMYHGLHGVGGSNDITVFCDNCKTMVYGGGGYANLNIFGHSYYATDKDGQVISMSDEVGHFTSIEQSYIAEYVYDVQWMKHIYIFDGYTMNNRYLISQIAGCSYTSNDTSYDNVKLQSYVMDYGRSNRGIEDFKDLPCHIGGKYIDKTGQTTFKKWDPITQNALSGAGVWGSITSNDAFSKGNLKLSEICRYPFDTNTKNHTSDRFLYALSDNSPTEDQPIEIIIDVSNRPVNSFVEAICIQFDHSHIASDFQVSFDIANNNEFTYPIDIKDNIDSAWYFANHQRPFSKIYRVKIIITKALYIEKLKYRTSSYISKEIEYNPKKTVGICNVGMPDADFVGRTFLGECGGNVYGDLTLNKDSTIKNVPTPVEDGDAVNKEYVDQQIAMLTSKIEELLASI